MVVSGESFWAHSIVITLNEFKWYIYKILFCCFYEKKVSLVQQFLKEYGNPRVIFSNWQTILTGTDNLCIFPQGMSNMLHFSATGQKKSTHAIRAQHNTCTICCKATNFFWIFASPQHGLYKDIKEFETACLCSAIPNWFRADSFFFSLQACSCH